MKNLGDQVENRVYEQAGGSSRAVVCQVEPCCPDNSCSCSGVYTGVTPASISGDRELGPAGSFRPVWEQSG